MTEKPESPVTKKRCDVLKPIFRAGDRVRICGRLATVDGLYKDWPTIIKYRYDGEDIEHLIISHFHDGPNRNIAQG